jgi:hypothetical protein
MIVFILRGGERRLTIVLEKLMRTKTQHVLFAVCAINASSFFLS